MRLSGFLYSFAAALTWGFVYTIDQKILGKVSPLGLVFINSIIGILFILPFVLVRPEILKTPLSSFVANGWWILLSCILAILANFFIYASIQSLGAPTASILEIIYPFFVVLFCVLFFKQGVNLPFLFGSLLLFIGSVIIIKWGQ